MPSTDWAAPVAGVAGADLERARGLHRRPGATERRRSASPRWQAEGVIPTIVHVYLGEPDLAQGDLEHAIRVFDQGLALCRASGNRDWFRSIAAGLGYASALQGRRAEGRTLLEEAISEDIRTGALQNHSLWVAGLSEVCRLAGRGEEAWQHACQALDLARQQQDRGGEAVALHQLGIVHAHAVPSNAAQAEAYYRQALALAEALGMRPLQAHCHHGLGTLYAKAGLRRGRDCYHLQAGIQALPVGYQEI